MLPSDCEEPLVLADGTKIDPKTGEVKKERRNRFVEVPSPSQAQALVTKARRSVADLPAPPTQLTGVALVAFYTLFGLPDHEIALAVDSKLSIEQIRRIRELDVYKEFMQNAKENILETSNDVVRDLFQKHAVNAAQTILDIADSGEDVLAFKASQDILDRAGHRPADIVEHRHRMEDKLNIVITRKDANPEIPVVDVTPERIIHEDI